MMREKSTTYDRGSPPVSPVMTSREPGTASTTRRAMSATVRLFAEVPTLKASPCTAALGASNVARNAAAMSRTCTNGRHGVPSERTRTSPVSTA